MTTDLANQPVMITGASGFVGTHLLQALGVAGYRQQQLVAVTLAGDEAIAGCRNVERLDITDRAATDRLIGNIKPRAIIHLAAIAEPAQARERHALAWAVNFHGVMNLADALLEHMPDGRFIFAGSSEVYGDSFLSNSGPIPETAALRPTNTYAATKAAADILLGQMAHDGLMSVRFRAFNHTGPGQIEAYVVASFARQVARIEAGLQDPFIHVGNLDVQRDFLDVRDVVRAYISAIDVDLGGPGDHVFNLASGNVRSIQSILDDLIEMSDTECEIRQDPERMRTHDVDLAQADISRLTTLLGFSPQIDFECSLADLLGYWRKQSRMA